MSKISGNILIQHKEGETIANLIESQDALEGLDLLKNFSSSRLEINTGDYITYKNEKFKIIKIDLLFSTQKNEFYLETRLIVK